jgi:UDP-glucose 4-epimerase
MATYLVTGGAGFIGSHLCDALLAAGHRVRVLDDLSTGKCSNLDARVELVVGDVGDVSAVAAAADGVEGIVHLAAIASVQRSTEDWAGTHRTNLTGTIHVFDAARKNGSIPVVYASSAAVYGNNPKLPLAEDSATKPLSAYGADKLGCELHAHVAGLVHGVPSAGFRFFNVFGPRQDPASPYSGVISIFAARVQKGQACTIQGDGGQARDFVYVADVVAALRKGLEAASVSAPVFNVGTGAATSVLDLALLLQRLARSNADPAFAPPRAGDIRLSLSDCTRLRALGWSPQTRLEAGLEATLDWLRSATP